MKVIFTDSVAGVASRGDIKNVKDGFFRNFLLPRKKAIFASEGALKEWEEKRKKMLIEKEQLKSHFEEITRRMAGGTLRIEKKITAKGTLYGGIKAGDIVKAIADQFNLEIPENAIVLDQSIKAVGKHEVGLHLAQGVNSRISIEIVEKK